jgi:hypothetical protein
MTTLESIWEEMAENPDDFLLHLVLADWIEEFGDESEQHKAACLRWTSRKRKRPWMNAIHWYPESYEKHWPHDLESNLPDKMFSLLPNIGGSVNKIDQRVAEFATYREAMEALFLVWKRCPQE